MGIVKLLFIIYGLVALVCASLLLPSGAIQAMNSDRTLISSQSVTVEYRFMWPGMLPDHPFYKLKVLRDKLVLKLVNNPVKRMEYYLLLADKGMYATKLLVEKGSISLAKTTALKAEHNYTLLVSEYKWMFWYEKPIPADLDGNIHISALKHQELLVRIAEGLTNQEDKNAFYQVAGFSNANLQELTSLISDKQ